MRLSVAMCTYNGEKYIREQLMSIRNQTLRIDEIVICDDCSEDDTVEIIENLIRQYDLPVRLHVNTWNHGYRKNFEQAICRCSGDIIFLSDQDDIWLPTKVETIIGYFNSNPDKVRLEKIIRWITYKIRIRYVLYLNRIKHVFVSYVDPFLRVFRLQSFVVSIDFLPIRVDPSEKIPVYVHT